MVKWISPIDYEKVVANWMRFNGFYNIKFTKKTGDYGADIIGEHQGFKYAVQCKLYSRPVGYHAIEEVIGAMHYYKCNGAIVVTNNTFTRQAREGAEKTGVVLITLPPFD